MSYEESYGYTIGTQVRDKDGLNAIMFIAEAATYYKKKGLTLLEQLNNIYEKYGYFKEKTFSITLKGVSGAEQIESMMKRLRENPIDSLGEFKIKQIIDFELGQTNNITQNLIEKTNLPKSNLLFYEMDNDCWFAVRPSGTEPKIKFYLGVKASTKELSEYLLDNLYKSIEESIIT